MTLRFSSFFFFQAEDGIRDRNVTGVQTCALPISAEFGPLVVTYRNGAPVRLQDLGRVLDDVQDNKSAAWFNGSRAKIGRASCRERVKSSEWDGAQKKKENTDTMLER